MRLLLVDDDPVSLRVLRLALEAAGHHVDLADTAEAALASFAARTPDGVVTDHYLGAMDGAELGRRIRHLPGGEGVFLLLVTGLEEGDAARIAEAAGFDAYLTKPIELSRLELLLEARR